MLPSRHLLPKEIGINIQIHGLHLLQREPSCLADFICVPWIQCKFKGHLKDIIIPYTQWVFSERHGQLINPNLLPHFSYNTRKGVFYCGRIPWNNISMSLGQGPLSCGGALHKAIFITNGASNNGPIDFCLTGHRPSGQPTKGIVGCYNLVGLEPPIGIHSAVWCVSRGLKHINFFRRTAWYI